MVIGVKVSKKISVILLIVTSVAIISTTHNLLASEKKIASSVSKVNKIVILQEKMDTNKNNLELIAQTKEMLSTSELNLDNTFIDRVNEKINSIPAFIRKNFTTEFNDLKEKKLLIDEKKLSLSKQEVQINKDAEKIDEKIKSTTSTHSKSKNDTNKTKKPSVMQSSESSKGTATSDKSTSEAPKETLKKPTNEKPIEKEYSSPTDVVKDGEGEITNFGGDGVSGSNYETGTFTPPADWDF